ncbi:unnamed protein product [Strongylus vulgaris]|uniref:Uncharacterized protein n=1 Tax=Strongylus vulgaris TaxID=40348 RepID=A0A3P7JAC9_STRVU|nr:unnamed protein product [Strongylus vulgaris]
MYSNSKIVVLEASQDDYERRERAIEKRQRDRKDQRDGAATRQERHIARIEITNTVENERIPREQRDDENDVRRVVTRTREATAMQRNSSEHKNAQVKSSSHSIPPPPPAPSVRITGFKVIPNKVVAEECDQLYETRGDEQFERQLKPLERKLLVREASERHQRVPQAEQMSGKMVVVNMGRIPQTRTGRGIDSTPDANRNPSTNPFLKGTEKRREDVGAMPNQQINNVQEVVQRMNSGEWPIKIDEEETRTKVNVGQNREQRELANQKEGKAHNWETLQKNRPTRESGRREKNVLEQEQPREHQREEQSRGKGSKMEQEHAQGRTKGETF